MDARTAAERPSPVNLRSVFAIAIPMTLAYGSTPFIGITDLAVIGQLGSAALIGAVGLGAVLFDFIGSALTFLRMGTTGLVAQATGAGDREAQVAGLWRAGVIAIVLGALIVVLQEPLIALFLWAMDPEEAVANALREYWAVRVFATPFMLLNYAVLGWLVGLGRATTGLALQVLLAGSNIVLSIWFVLGLGLGVTGVAAASFCAEALTLALSLAIVWRALHGGPKMSVSLLFERHGFLRNLAVNRDIMIRSVILLVVFGLFAAAGARFGTETLAANAILMSLFLLSAHVLDGLATAAEQLCGRSVGARDRVGFQKAMRLTVVAATVISLVVGAFWLAAGGPLIALMTSVDEVRDMSAQFLWWAALTPVTGALAFVMDGLFIGATWTATMRNMTLASVLIFAVAWWFLTGPYGNHGLWAAFNIWLVVRGLCFAAAVPFLTRRTFAA